jgi:hypothetical protein
LEPLFVSLLQRALHWVTIAILSVLFTSFINLEAFEFSTSDKVSVHFEANSQSITAG